MRTHLLSAALLLGLACGDETGAFPRSSPEGASTPPRSAALSDAGSHDARIEPERVDGGGAEDSGSEPAPLADAGRPADPAEGEPLCDGSAGVRLVFAGESSTIPFPHTSENRWFRQPYGVRFFAIEGTCRYYVSAGISQGILTGTLSEREAEQLSSDLGWNDLDDWGAYGIDHPIHCADGGSKALRRRGAAAVGCTCTCDATAPAGLGDALIEGMAWMGRLRQRGVALEGAVSAMAMPEASRTNGEPEVEWPLQRAIASIPNLIVAQGDSRLTTGPFARFEDPKETEALRSLRARANDDTVCVIATDQGQRYALYVRDELPEAIARTWLSIP